MNDNQIVAIIVALINCRYLIPGKDNEKTAKEIVDIYRILKEKTYDNNSAIDFGGEAQQFMNNMQFGPGA